MDVNNYSMFITRQLSLVPEKHTEVCVCFC